MRCTHLLVAAAIGVSGGAASGDSIEGVYLGESEFHYVVEGVPDFDQKRKAGDGILGLPNDGCFYCAPTAATDVMAWLANNGEPAMPPGTGEWSLYTTPYWSAVALERYNDVTAAIATLGQLMQTNPDRGTGSQGLLDGIRAYLEMHAPDGRYRVFQRGVDGGDWVSQRFRIPTVADAALALVDDAIAIMRWGYYDWSDAFVEGPELIRRTGGHLVVVTSIDRVDGETYLRVRNPGSYESFLRQGEFQESRYRVEAVPFLPPGGVGAVTQREVLLRPTQTWDEVSPGSIKCIDEFTIITPRHGFSVAESHDGLQLHRFDPFTEDVTTEIVPLPAGDTVVRAALGVDQQRAFVVVDNGSGMRLAQYDVASGDFADVAPLDDASDLALTRFGTLVVLEGQNQLTHLDPYDLADPVTALSFSSVDGPLIDVDDVHDTVWHLSTTFQTVSAHTVPDLDPYTDVILPSAIQWNAPIDFAVAPGASSLWFATGGQLIEVQLPKGAPIDLWYDTPFPVEAVDVDEAGALTLTMVDGAERLVRRFMPDANEVELVELPSALADGVAGAVGLDFHLAPSPTNVDDDLYDNPGSDDLEITSILDTFNDPEPPPAGESCGLVDDFEDLAANDLVTTRTIDGVEIALSTGTGVPIHARTWNAGVAALYGAVSTNDPFEPGQVSGARFVSGALVSSPQEHFHDHKPVRFEFDEPVAGFGLTTVDLMEDLLDPDETLALRAYDASGALVAEHLRVGPQGPSGLALRWHVWTGAANIVRVELDGSIEHGGGYGIDDLELCRAPCTTDLDASGDVGLPDLLLVLANWGPCAGCLADVNGDDVIDLGDLLAVLSTWGPCP